MKKRWSPVKPAITGARGVQRGAVGAVRHASPLRSPMFSPSVSRPFTASPHRGVRAVLGGHASVRCLKARRLGRPTSRRLPAPSLLPLVVERVDNLVADHRHDGRRSSRVVGRGLKKGGCRIAAGNTIRCSPGVVGVHRLGVIPHSVRSTGRPSRDTPRCTRRRPWRAGWRTGCRASPGAPSSPASAGSRS